MPHGLVETKKITGIGATTLEINSKKLNYSLSY